MHPESGLFSSPSRPSLWSKPYHLSPGLLQLPPIHLLASTLALLEYLLNRAARMIILQCKSDHGIYLFKPPQRCPNFLMVYPTTRSTISCLCVLLLHLSSCILILKFTLPLLYYSHTDLLAVVQTF